MNLQITNSGIILFVKHACVRCVVLFLAFVSSVATSAQNTGLPGGLSQNSSVEELIQWLDENAIPKARIGVEIEVSEDHLDPSELFNYALSENATFSHGFRLRSLDGCKLTLRNEDLRLLELWSGSYNPKLIRLKDIRVDPGSDGTYYGEIVIPLSDLSLKKGRSPFIHTRKPEKAKRLGTWRVMFRVVQTSFFDLIRGKYRDSELILIGVRSYEDDNFYNSLWGETIRFTFDEELAARNFYRVFRRTIELCSR